MKQMKMLNLKILNQFNNLIKRNPILILIARITNKDKNIYKPRTHLNLLLLLRNYNHS